MNSVQPRPAPFQHRLLAEPHFSISGSEDLGSRSLARGERWEPPYSGNSPTEGTGPCDGDGGGLGTACLPLSIWELEQEREDTLPSERAVLISAGEGTRRQPVNRRSDFI